MNDGDKVAAVLWSGGKDCALALHEAVAAGLDVRLLVTFAPPDAKFLAHPLAVMESQAEALGIPHHIVRIGESYAESYTAGIENLRDQFGIKTLVTGDIAEVDGCPNWVRQRSEGTGVAVETPLWHRDRKEILTNLLDQGFKIVVSCLRSPELSEDWIGREIDAAAFAELRVLEQESGVDPCGENGEFHTITLDGPLFMKPLCLNGCKPAHRDGLVCLDIDGIELVEKV